MKNDELVLTAEDAKEMGCSLDDITIGDASDMHEATGMIFECNDGHLMAIYD